LSAHWSVGSPVGALLPRIGNKTIPIRPTATHPHNPKRADIGSGDVASRWMRLASAFRDSRMPINRTFISNGRAACAATSSKV
jgi:hypothetical protein